MLSYVLKTIKMAKKVFFIHETLNNNVIHFIIKNTHKFPLNKTTFSSGFFKKYYYLTEKLYKLLFSLFFLLNGIVSLKPSTLLERITCGLQLLFDMVTE